MSGTLDPRYAMPFHPQQPDMGASLDYAQKAWQLQQAAGKQNALQALFNDPDSIDQKTGMPTRNAMTRLFAIDPQLGMKMTDAQSVFQARQTGMAKSADDLVHNLNEEAYNALQSQIASGVPDAQATQNVSRMYSERFDAAEKSGMPLGNMGYSRSFDKTAAAGAAYKPLQPNQVLEERHRETEEKISQERIDLEKERVKRESAPVAEEERLKRLAEFDVRKQQPGLKPGTPEYQNAVDDTYEKKKASYLAEAAGLKKEATLTPGSQGADRMAISRDVESDPDWKSKTPGQRAAEIEKRYKDASTVGISDDDAHWVAENVWGGNPNATVGMARSTANMSKVTHQIAEIARERNATPEDLNAKIAQFHSQMRESGTIGQRLGAIEVSGAEAVRVAGLVDDAYSRLGRTNFRPYNQLKAMVERGTTNPDFAAAVAADFSLVTAYARALNPSGIPRESDIAKGEQMLNQAGSFEEHHRVVNQMLMELDQIEGAAGDAREKMVQRIRTARDFGPLNENAGPRAGVRPAATPPEPATNARPAGVPENARQYQGKWFVPTGDGKYRELAPP